MSNEIEKSLVIIKPDAVKRGLIGVIVQRLEQRGLFVRRMQMRLATQEVLLQHYAEHVGKSFCADLINFMMSGRMVIMVIEGNNAVQIIRNMVGTTHDPEKGTIRGDYSCGGMYNLVHASDSVESALREIDVWKDFLDR